MVILDILPRNELCVDLRVPCNSRNDRTEITFKLAYLIHQKSMEITKLAEISVRRKSYVKDYIDVLHDIIA